MTNYFEFLSAFGTIATAVYVVKDFYNKYGTKNVSYVKVPNHNQNGFEEYTTSTHPYGSHNATKITINADNSVLILKTKGQSESYRTFISWRNEK